MNTADALTNVVEYWKCTGTVQWIDLVQDTVYQILPTRTVNTQHGPSVILSLQKSDGSCCSAWACGMLTKELLQNHMVLNSRLFVRPTGPKTSKVGGDTQFISIASVLMILLTNKLQKRYLLFSMFMLYD